MKTEKANITVTMPDSVRDTIVQCLMQKEEKPTKLTTTQKAKLIALRRLVDSCDSPTTEFVQLSDELRKELGPEYFDFALNQ